MLAPPPDARHRRTRAEQVALHAQIIQIAQSLFEDGGLEAISMRKIAQLADVSAMGLYRYFPSKAHLMRHIWDDLLLMAHGAASRGVDHTSDAHARLRSYLDSFIQYWLDNRSHYRVVSSVRDTWYDTTTGTQPPGLRQVPQLLLDALADLLCACCAPPRTSLEWRHLLEMLLCKALGFLHAVLGVLSYPLQDVQALKRRIVDDMVLQVRTAATIPQTQQMCPNALIPE